LPNEFERHIAGGGGVREILQRVPGGEPGLVFLLKAEEAR